MANTKSAIKKARQDIKRRAINLARASAVKTAIKKVREAVAANEDATELLREATAKIARARGKGLFHANTAANKISGLAKLVAKSAK